MAIVHASVDDGHLGALTQDALLMQLIHARHVMDGVVLVYDVAVKQRLRLSRSEEELARRPRLVDDVKGLEQVGVGLVRLDCAPVKDVAIKDLKDLTTVALRNLLGGS